MAGPADCPSGKMQWREVGTTPRRVTNLGTSSSNEGLCVHGGYMYAMSENGPAHLCDDKLFRTALPLHVDSGETQWEEVPLPEGQWAWCNYVFSHDSSLYIIPTPYPFRYPLPLFRRLEDGAWQKVSDLPEKKHSFGALICRDKLVLTGGVHDHRSLTSVHALDLSSEGSAVEWERLPDLPTASYSHKLVADGSTIYAFGCSMDHSLSPEIKEVMCLSLGTTGGHLELASGGGGGGGGGGGEAWTRSDLPKLPTFHSGALTVDGQFMVIGGLVRKVDGRFDGTRRCHLYMSESGAWQQVSRLTTNRQFGHCLVHNGDIYCVGGVSAGKNSPADPYREAPACNTIERLMLDPDDGSVGSEAVQ